MPHLLAGTIHTMRVTKQMAEGYTLTKGDDSVFLSVEDGAGAQTLSLDDFVDVFLFTNKEAELFATTDLPKVMIGVYDWAEVVETLPLGTFVTIGIDEDVLIYSEDLPLFRSAWPKQGDQLYMTIKADNNNRLLGVPATEGIFADLFEFAEAEDVDLNEEISGRVIRVDREGTVILTENNYRAFIHHTERTVEPRLGEQVTGRVIEVKEDGTLNVSLLPLKHERMDEDAERILAYLEKVGGEMLFGDKSDPEDIRSTFQMSKSAFKRALGRLMKKRKVNQADGKTFLV